MFKYLLLSFLIHGYALSVYCQNLERARKHIDTLCSPAFHGRGYVNSGDSIAAEYLQKHFRILGLKPVNNQYVQRFRFSINTFPGKLKLKLGKRELVPGEEFIADAVSGKGKGTAKLIYLDSVSLFNEKTREAILNDKKIKRKAIAFHGNHYQYITSLQDSTLDKIYSAKAVIRIDKKLTASVSTISYNINSFFVSASGWKPEQKLKFRMDQKLLENYKSGNVIGIIPGQEEPDSIILITAHYDHLGRMGKKTYFPGANDNASGISMLLELADHYSKQNNRYTFAFIAFAAEEAGLLGSSYFVKNPLFPLSSIKLMINLDLVGTGDEGITVVNATLHPDEFSRIIDINKEKGYFNLVKSRGPAANSDHFYFSKAGVKSFFIYTLGGIQAYHDVNDRPETLPLTKYKELFDLLTRFIAGIK
jgi:aminopeptidase YwaD